MTTDERRQRQEWGYRLWCLRRNRGWTQRELAEELDMSQQKLHSMERVGRTFLTDEFIDDICDVLGVAAADVTAEDWRERCNCAAE